jgi:hypothetical protein
LKSTSFSSIACQTIHPKKVNFYIQFDPSSPSQAARELELTSEPFAGKPYLKLYLNIQQVPRKPQSLSIQGWNFKIVKPVKFDDFKHCDARSVRFNEDG